MNENAILTVHLRELVPEHTVVATPEDLFGVAMRDLAEEATKPTLVPSGRAPAPARRRELEFASALAKLERAWPVHGD